MSSPIPEISAAAFHWRVLVFKVANPLVLTAFMILLFKLLLVTVLFMSILRHLHRRARSSPAVSLLRCSAEFSGQLGSPVGIHFRWANVD
jgi:hypothetical protein